MTELTIKWWSHVEKSLCLLTSFPFPSPNIAFSLSLSLSLVLVLLSYSLPLNTAARSIRVWKKVNKNGSQTEFHGEHLPISPAHAFFFQVPQFQISQNLHGFHSSFRLLQVSFFYSVLVCWVDYAVVFMILYVFFLFLLVFTFYNSFRSDIFRRCHSNGTATWEMDLFELG